MKPTVGVQLFTLRDFCEKDFEGVLKRVADIGFRAVEFGGFHNTPVAGLRKALDRLSLKAISAHIGLDRLTNDVAGVAEDARVLGLKYVVCPGIFDEKKLTAARYREVARTLQSAGEKLAGDGFQLAYHNHAFEFDSFEGGTGFDILIKETGPEAVKFEVDTYWVDEGGHDVVNFIRGLGKRCPLLHLKDRAKDGTFAEVGSGTLDFTAILATAREMGVDACMVEQDSCPRDPFDCIETSLKFLRQKGMA